MSEETVSIPKQKIVELVKLLGEAKQILQGTSTLPKSVVSGLNGKSQKTK